MDWNQGKVTFGGVTDLRSVKNHYKGFTVGQSAYSGCPRYVALKVRSRCVQVE